MNQSEQKQKIKNIYNSFLVKLNALKKRQFAFLKSLLEKKHQADLEDIRKNFH